VGKISKYDIVYKGLKEGKHKFEYQIDDTFFELFEGSLAQKGNISAEVILDKKSTLLILQFNIEGTIELMCDRCAENYNQPIRQIHKLFVKFGEEKNDDGEDIIWISPEENSLNIAQLLYEFIVLSIPVKHAHPDRDGKSTCNAEMIEQLKKYSSAEKETEPDHRWDILKDFGNNN
jgi:uncharacterized protein